MTHTNTLTILLYHFNQIEFTKRSNPAFLNTEEKILDFLLIENERLLAYIFHK